MDILKKYILIVCIAIAVTILFVLFAPIDWEELQTPSQQRRDLIQNCIDEHAHLTPRECTELYPFDNIMTRPVIDVTDLFN